jgi:NAD(P)-dependent dehydrogenase (short-subunit alcohol dehydrogenase family)
MARVLITGASQGIGRAIATELIRRGHEVVATGRNAKDLDGLDAYLKLSLDVTQQDDVDRIRDEVGNIDVLINNAGALVVGAVEAVPVSEFESLYAVNTMGALRMSQAFLPSMRRNGHGRILFISSVVGRIAQPGVAAYAASKWALEAIAETLALETESFGISIGLMEPGAVETVGSRTAARIFALDDDPYAPKAATGNETRNGRENTIPAAEVARVVADAVEIESLPLRTPVGAAAVNGLDDWHAAPVDQAFRWVPRSN